MYIYIFRKSVRNLFEFFEKMKKTKDSCFRVAIKDISNFNFFLSPVKVELRQVSLQNIKKIDFFFILWANP